MDTNAWTAWIDTLIARIDALGIGGNWQLYLALVIVFVIVAGLWVRMNFPGKVHAEQKKKAKKFEEYCRMYDAGQRDSEDKDFRKFVQNRNNQEAFLKRRGERWIPQKPMN